MYYPIKMYGFIQRMFADYIWRVQTAEKIIYLTFDDGPNPNVTPWVLSLLKKYNAHATFFCLGKNLKKYPRLVNEILKYKHRLANHTYSHMNGWLSDDTAYLDSIEKTEFYLKENTSKLFRPPYGKIKKSQANLLINKGYRIVMWELISGDFDPKLNIEKSLKKMLKNTKPGSIVVFHDSVKAKKNLQNLLPKALEHWHNQGYLFKRL